MAQFNSSQTIYDHICHTIYFGPLGPSWSPSISSISFISLIRFVLSGPFPFIQHTTAIFSGHCNFRSLACFSSCCGQQTSHGVRKWRLSWLRRWHEVDRYPPTGSQWIPMVYPCCIYIYISMCSSLSLWTFQTKPYLNRWFLASSSPCVPCSDGIGICSSMARRETNGIRHMGALNHARSPICWR